MISQKDIDTVAEAVATALALGGHGFVMRITDGSWLLRAAQGRHDVARHTQLRINAKAAGAITAPAMFATRGAQMSKPSLFAQSVLVLVFYNPPDQ